MKTQIQTYSIPEHWDTGATIAADASAIIEFETWSKHAADSPDWQGDEFTLADFVRYIETLKAEGGEG